MQVKFNKNELLRKIQIAVKTAVATGAHELQSEVRDRLSRQSSNIGSGGIASMPGSPPAMNTGNLARSIQAVDATDSPNHPRYRVGTNAEYARIQEYGGRISAKKGKFLPVPVGVEGKRAMRDAGGNIRSLNLRLVRTSSGKLLLVKDLVKGQKVAKGSKAAKGNQSVILFVLKKEVYLPARPYLRPSYEAKKAKISARVQEAISGVLKGVAA